MPAFAVDRTQLLIYDIRRLEDAKQIPPLPVYMDSPMAIDVTDIYRRHHEDLRLSAEELRADPFAVQTVHVMRSPEQSKQINSVHTPAIIISASGMATGGRVLHHLQQRLPDARNCVLLAGFPCQPFSLSTDDLLQSVLDVNLWISFWRSTGPDCYRLNRSKSEPIVWSVRSSVSGLGIGILK